MSESTAVLALVAAWGIGVLCGGSVVLWFIGVL